VIVIIQHLNFSLLCLLANPIFYERIDFKSNKKNQTPFQGLLPSSTVDNPGDQIYSHPLTLCREFIRM